MDTATVGQTLLHVLWPSTCAHCQEDLPREWLGPLCRPCETDLMPAEPPWCERCAVPLKGARPLCLACAKGPHACRLIRAASLYRGPAVAVVHAFKFRGRRSAARAAGIWMAQAMARNPELGRPDALVPVPLHPRRRRSRGYNQALLLCETLSAATGIPIADILSRRRDTRPLWSLRRVDRLKVLDDAFVCPTGEARGKRLLVVDDVCTTAASLEGCAKALRAAGAVEVNGYVFARQAGGPAS